MAADFRFLKSYIDSDATYRLWATGIHDQLIACGLQQTTDTGQINLATVTKPAAFGTAGYEIFKFTDALQATNPVFIKITYAISGSADRVSLSLQVGRSTNGAGLLAGGSAGVALNAGASATAGDPDRRSFCSGDGSRITLATNIDPASTAMGIFINVERTRTGAGVPTDDGVIIGTSTAANFGSSCFTFAGILSSTRNSTPSGDVSTGNVGVGGTNVSVYPNVVGVNGKTHAASYISYPLGAIGALTSFQVQHWGAPRTFVALGNSVASVGAAIAMMWEDGVSAT